MILSEILDDFLVAIIDRFGKAPVCNGHPERALKIGNFVFPLCYRCMFITIGLIIGILIVLYLIDQKQFIWKIKYIFFGIVLIIPTFMDGLVQALTDYVSNNFIRSITGLIAGIGISICIYTFVCIIEKLVLKKNKKLTKL